MSIPRLVALWGAPRSLSTVFLRIMIERGDFAVVHEPFSNFAALGYFDVGKDRASSYSDLVALLHRKSREAPLFFKDTTEYRYASILEDPRIMNDAVNTFIIREPAEAIASHCAINPNLTLAEVGYENLFEIFSAVRDATGAIPVVVDAADLLANPHGTVRAYCARAGLPFRPDALNWQPEERDEWSRTAHWHRDVSASAGIHRNVKLYAIRVDNDERLARMYRYHRPFYEKLREYRVGPL